MIFPVILHHPNKHGFIIKLLSLLNILQFVTLNFFQTLSNM